MEVARLWNREYRNAFRLSVVDEWRLTDNRPETTFEGRHWVSEWFSTGNYAYRPLIGEAEGNVNFRNPTN